MRKNNKKNREIERGDIFEITANHIPELYVVAQISTSKYLLISLRDGNRWTNESFDYGTKPKDIIEEAESEDWVQNVEYYPQALDRIDTEEVKK